MKRQIQNNNNVELQFIKMLPNTKGDLQQAN